MTSLVTRFLNYIAIDTRSDDYSESTPTTPGQWTLAKQLFNELTALELTDVTLTDSCFVHAVLPSNVPYKTLTIGLVAHLDTSPAYNGNGIQPLTHYNYQGEILLLNPQKNIRMSPDTFPELLRYIGHDLITSDGTTLLGADGKAGIAEIMTLLEKLLLNPSIPHGDIHIVFTPDEETDRGGIGSLDTKLFPVDFAITMDGDGLGEVNFENFNAAHAHVTINGLSIHPGEGKGRLINAARIATEWVSMLPQDETPESTSNYEGFFHVESIMGGVDQASIYCIIRDFDSNHFMRRKKLLQQITHTLNTRYGSQIIQLTLQDDYTNMQSAIENKPWLSSGIIKSIEKSGQHPRIRPIRGGSDGAWLATLGIASPNLYIGSHYAHGPYEFASIQAMEAAVITLECILETFATPLSSN